MPHGGTQSARTAQRADDYFSLRKNLLIDARSWGICFYFQPLTGCVEVGFIGLAHRDHKNSAFSELVVIILTVNSFLYSTRDGERDRKSHYNPRFRRITFPVPISPAPPISVT